jgi:predicted molibdopterin-dependent oxidoreductase YjgC
MSGHIRWNGMDVPFTRGETVAQALNRAGIADFGAGALGQTQSVFCGIGQCQNCLVIIDGSGPREACLTLCQDGLVTYPMEGRHE